MTQLAQQTELNSRPGIPQPTADRKIVSKGILSVLDQGLVSGTRFVTTIAIGRLCGAEELGQYSLIMSIYLLAIGIHQAIVFGPYTIFSNRANGPMSQGYSRHVLEMFAGLALSMSILLLIAGGVIQIFELPVGTNLGGLLLLMAVCLPCFLLRDFARQRSFAGLDLRTVLRVDGITAAVQITLLGILIFGATLDTVTALIATALATLVGGGWLIVSGRSQFQKTQNSLRTSIHTHWDFGRWNLGAQIAELLTWYLLSWIILAELGMEATGIFAACLTVIAILNPLILALNNLLSPHSARVYENGGGAELLSTITRTTWTIGAITALFCLVLAVCGQYIFALFFGTDEYSGAIGVLVLLGLALLAEVIGDTANHALRAVDRPELSFHSAAVGLVIMLSLAWYTIERFGLIGAALALLAGSSTTAIYRWIAMLRVFKKDLAGGDS